MMFLGYLMFLFLARKIYIVVWVLNRMNKKAGILGVILILIFVILIVIFGYLIYQNLPGENRQLSVVFNSKNNFNVTGPLTANQFIPNLRFNHNDLTYYSDGSCSLDKMQRMKEAFEIIQNKTKIISFRVGVADSDIFISCSDKEVENSKNVFIAGEGGPREYVNSTIYPIIIRGEILLYKSSDCKSPVVELHELLHVFGFNHTSNEKDIMYPYIVGCNQVLSQEYIDDLISLYSIKPTSDLYFGDVNASEAGRYLNFNLSVINRGMIAEQNASVEVYVGSESLGRFYLDGIDLGAGKEFRVGNLKLPSRNPSLVEFRVYSSESDVAEDIVRASLG